MGLRVNIYRTAGIDCTLGGASSKVDQFTITNVEGPSDPSPHAPAAVLVKGALPGIVHIVPQAVIDANKRSMFGSNFASTSDSRFDKAIEKLTGNPFYGAVAIHDRVEG